MKIDDIRNKVAHEAKEEASIWFVKQCENPYEHFFLYYDQFEYISFRISNIPLTSAWVLASLQRIGPGDTEEQVVQFIVDTVWKLPILNRKELKDE